MAAFVGQINRHYIPIMYYGPYITFVPYDSLKICHKHRNQMCTPLCKGIPKFFIKEEKCEEKTDGTDNDESEEEKLGQYVYIDVDDDRVQEECKDADTFMACHNKHDGLEHSEDCEDCKECYYCLQENKNLNQTDNCENNSDGNVIENVDYDDDYGGTFYNNYNYDCRTNKYHTSKGKDCIQVRLQMKPISKCKCYGDWHASLRSHTILPKK